MENLSSQDMENIVAQAGVTIAISGKTTISSEFTSIAWGDPDGTGGNTTEGWLIIEGQGSGEGAKTKTMVSFKDSLFKIDAGTTNADGLNIFGDDTPEIPANRSYVKVGLPEKIEMTTTGASEYKISLNNSPVNDGTENSLGRLRIKDFRTELINSPDTIYIYAH